MSAFGGAALGIDVSDGTLKAVRLSRRGGRLTLQHTWRLPIDDRPDGELEALRALLHQARPGPGLRIVISAPTRGLFSRTYTLPAMSGERVAELVRYEVLAELQQPADDLVIGFVARRGAGERPVHAIAVRRAQVDAFRRKLAEHTVPWDDLEAPGLALAAYVDLERRSRGDRVMLGVGRTASQLVIQSAGGLWTRHLPLGLRDAEPEALAERLRDEIDAALASAVPADQHFRPDELVLSEEGALDARLTGALKRVLDMPVVRIAELTHIRASWRLRHSGQDAAQALSMGQAFGLALAGVRASPLRCPVVEGESRRAAARRLPAVTASVLLAAGALFALGELSAIWADRLEATLPSQLREELLDRVHERERLLAECTRLEQRSLALEALAHRRVAVLQARRALASVGQLVASRELTQRLHVEQLWLSSAEAGRPGTLSLTLHADPVLDAELAPRLQAVLRPEFGEAQVHGPEPAPTGGLSRWMVDVALP